MLFLFPAQSLAVRAVGMVRIVRIVRIVRKVRVLCFLTRLPFPSPGNNTHLPDHLQTVDGGIFFDESYIVAVCNNIVLAHHILNKFFG